MKKFIILIPVYNDWKSVFKLLGEMDIEIAQLESEFSALIINDGSTEEMPKITDNYKNFKSINLINMKKNQGHSRCNATGIKYLSDKQNFDYLIVMDGDGEDRPEEIKLLVDKILENANTSVVARRVKRTDYPGREIAKKIQIRWNKNFPSKKILSVYGNEWCAGNLSYHLESRPKWIGEKYGIIKNRARMDDMEVFWVKDIEPGGSFVLYGEKNK